MSSPASPSSSTPSETSPRTSLLILTSSTGSGHDKRAEAISEWCQFLYGDSLTVHVEQIIENSSLIGRFGVWLYNQIQKHAPFLHHVYFIIVELFTFTHRGGVSYGGVYYRQLIATLRPTHILSVHDSTNRGYFDDAAKILGKKNVRCMTYCGEFSGGYGFSSNWIAKKLDHFYARTENTRKTAIDAGIPAQKTSVFHKVLPPPAFNERLNNAQKSELIKSLNLDPTRFTLFLATGGFGANHHLRFLNVLKPFAGRIQCIVVCGKNEAVHQQVIQWNAKHPELNLFVEGYSKRMSALLQISDAIISRGGANTTMEALHFECPLIYDTLGGLMPQEYCTVRYFLEHNAARLIKRPAHLATIIAEWLDHPESYHSIKTHLKQLNPKEDPQDFIRSLFQD